MFNNCFTNLFRRNTTDKIDKLDTYNIENINPVNR